MTSLPSEGGVGGVDQSERSDLAASSGQSGRTARARTAFVALAISTVATSVALLGGTHLTAGSYFCALVIAYGSFAVLVFALHHRAAVPAWPVLVAGGALLIVSMVQPPIESGDVWSYASYGRMVAVHHDSPWDHVPANYPHDPYTPRVVHFWRHTPSVYGPVFALPAAAVMAVAGTNATVARLGFQLLAALSVAAALLLVGRETRWDPTALAILAVNPLVPICVVNAGHNDAWVGLLLLGAVLLATRRRWAWAGVFVALAAMIKVTALLALIALGVWALRRAGPRAAAKLLGWAVGVCIALVAAAGGSDVVRAMRWNSWRMTSGNLWGQARNWFFLQVGGAGHADQVRLATVAVIVTIALAGYLVARHRRAAHPALLVGLTVLAYALGSAYVWPWYVTWGLIPVALCPRAPTTRLLVAVGAVLELGAVPYVHFTATASPGWDPALRIVGLVNEALPWILAALAAGVVVVGSYRWRDAHAISSEQRSPRW
ncbi:MAG: DUF2029 domain-containing protein [Actinomycetota bacterium]|nr:DUF2029 domain-containing protein [Actinomycetota bacterium]